MISTAQFIDKFRSGTRLVVAVIGDSTSAGMGANPGPGGPYMLDNLPNGGPNFTAGDPFHIVPDSIGYVSQSVQDNVLIPSWVRLLRTYLESINPNSKVYNYGASGWTAGQHVSNGTVARIAARTPKPEVCFVNIGINNLKNDVPVGPHLATICSQLDAAGILPILCLPNNIGEDKRTGRWDGIEVPGFPGPPSQWQRIGVRWSAVRMDIQMIAGAHNYPVIDFGDAAGTLDICKLYDPYHPNPSGYLDMFNVVKDWLVGRAIRLLVPGRAKPVFYSEGGAVRINTSEGLAQFATGGDGAVSIVTPSGVVSLA